MSYTNNPASVLAGVGISITPTTGTGANSITISSNVVDQLAVRVATTTPVTASATIDEVISVQVPGPLAVTVNLPAGAAGIVFTIKDGLGLAGILTPITIVPLGLDLIDGSATALITVPYGSLTLVYVGTQWILI